MIRDIPSNQRAKMGNIIFNGYYQGKIKVIGPDLKCFPVDKDTLEALACSVYDPWAYLAPDPLPVETISYAEWLRRK